MTIITDDVGAKGYTKRVSVGAAAVQAASSQTQLNRGVIVKAGAGNTGVVYVGFSSGVTANTAVATDGYPLAAAAEVGIPINDLSSVWFIADSSSQEVSLLYI